MKNGLTCSLPIDYTKKALTHEKVEIVKNLIRTQHLYILQNVNDQGRIFYDAYPHHIWSNPFMYKEFYKLDKRDIVSYKYVIQAVCLDYKDGQPTYETMKEEYYDIPVI